MIRWPPDWKNARNIKPTCRKLKCWSKSSNILLLDSQSLGGNWNWQMNGKRFIFINESQQWDFSVSIWTCSPRLIGFSRQWQGLKQSKPIFMGSNLSRLRYHRSFLRTISKKKEQESAASLGRHHPKKAVLVTDEKLDHFMHWAKNLDDQSNLAFHPGPVPPLGGDGGWALVYQSK